MEPHYIELPSFGAPNPGAKASSIVDEILGNDLGLIGLAVVGLAVLLVPLYFFAAGASTGSRRNAEPEPREPAPAPAPASAPAPAPAPTPAPAPGTATAAAAAPEPTPDPAPVPGAPNGDNSDTMADDNKLPAAADDEDDDSGDDNAVDNSSENE